MKYFIDCEFIEDGVTIDLASLGMVCEDGRELYILSTDCKLENASDWVVKHVFPHFPPAPGPQWMPKSKMRDLIMRFVGPGRHEFWGYYSAYDWVAFCQIFGSMVDLPKGFPYYCRDIKQLCDELGNPQLPAKFKPEHHPLVDAQWTAYSYSWLRAYEQQRYPKVRTLPEKAS